MRIGSPCLLKRAKTRAAVVAAAVLLCVSNAPAQRPAISQGHLEPILQAIPSPDGRRIYTADRTTLRVWDVESGKELGLLSRHDDEHGPWSIDFDQTSNSIIIARQDSVVSYDAETYALNRVRGDASPKQRVRGAWDDSSQLYYAVTRSSSEYLYVQVLGVGKGAQWGLAKAGLVHVPATSSDVHSVVLLPENRLLIGTFDYSVVVDTNSLEAIRLNRGDWRRFVEGPNGMVYAMTPVRTVDGKRMPSRLERLDPVTLEPVATLERDVPQIGFAGKHAFDPKQQMIALAAGSEILGVDPKTLEPRLNVTLPGLGQLQYVARIPSKDTEDWVVTDGRKVLTCDLKFAQPLLEFTADPFRPSVLVTAPTGFDFIVSNGQHVAKYVRFGPKGPEIRSAPFGIRQLSIHGKTSQIAYTSTWDSVQQSKLENWNKLPEPPRHAAGAKGRFLLHSSDGGLLMAVRADGFSLHDLNTGTEILNKPYTLAPTSRFRPAAISPDNRLAIVSGAESKIAAFDLRTGALSWEVQAKNEYTDARRDLFFFVAPDMFACVNDRKLEYRSSRNGALLFDVELPTNVDHAVAAAISSDQRYLAVGREMLIHVIDTETGESVFHEGVSWGHVASLAFFADSEHIAVGSEDGLIRIWSVKKKQPLFSLALFAGTNEWAAVSTDFRFDASKEAMDSMYLLHENAVLPLESLFEQLYTPKLVTRLIAGEPIPAPEVEVKTLKPAPITRLELANGTRNLVVEDDTPDNQVDEEVIRVKVVVEAGAAKLEEVRVYHNGKLVHNPFPRENQFAGSFDITLVPGENNIRAIAINNERTESLPAILPLQFKPRIRPIATAEPSSGGGLQLHLLIMGVNAYANSKYNLNYAVADATAVRAAAERHTKSIFTQTNVNFLVDAQVRKSSVLEAFKKMAATAGPRDVFVFYYAGHGVMTQDSKPEFFLVPHDVTQLYGADDQLRAKGISAAELQELAKVMPAQKQLFILDACQSAGALKTVAMRGAAEEKAIAQLARSTGTHWLTASGSEQFATEFEQLGHGAFTYVLLDALSGKADTGDGRVTVNELKAYLEAQVPEVTQKYKGTPQFPSSYGFGQDFPVAVVK
jgi:WD40 repeat protein